MGRLGNDSITEKTSAVKDDLVLIGDSENEFASRELKLKQILGIGSPTRTAFVDASFTDLGNPRFTTVELALVWARAQSPTRTNPVVVKCFLDGSNNPLAVPSDEDYYDLMDEGIRFVSDFDVWKDFVMLGGTLDANELLYTIDFNEIPITIDFN